jgi:uncharacterized membrane protein YraQ (UPF0718 family)
VAAGVVILVLVGRNAGLRDLESVETFVLIFSSIVIEALPFILLGALVSAAIGVYAPERLFTRIARLPVGLQLPGAALSGFAFPVCECGSVPVARRLIARGVHPAAGVAFMLASPVLNPIVLASTWVAYSGRGLGVEMVIARAELGIVLAIVAGWTLARSAGTGLLRARPLPATGHAHGHSHAGHTRTGQFAEQLADDFLFMGKFIVLGAALAAAIQTAVPQRVVSGIADIPVLSALALMGIAFMLSLCSEADAFVAVSFTAFPIGAQLAFLVFGPVVDTKLALLYGATFRRGFVPRLVLIAVPVVVLGSLFFEALLE